jgi:thiopurine S-methyltransferase
MEKETTTPLEFWSQVWKEGIVRFHQKAYNPEMTHFLKDIDLKNKTILIPLAGKTKDILFFLEKGAMVTAVEFVEEAIIDFFTENNIPYQKEKNLYKAHNLNFFAMDFFQLKTNKPFDLLYDRAGQVVFTPSERPYYYHHISTLIDPHTMLFLLSIDHDGDPNYGPPHKISAQEIIVQYKKMGIELTKLSDKREIASEKMQAAGIKEINSFVLSSGI